jgi:tryptophan synthase alpha chain
MDRIASLFATKKNRIISVYFTAGFPQLHDTVTIIKELAHQGVDMIEIGIPYSDPMADGPVIQHSSQQALENGMSQKLLFEQLATIRQEVSIPLVFMGYLNTIMQFGFERFCQQAAHIGIDGLIIPDIPLDVYVKEYKTIVEQYGLKFILLITPETTEERIRQIDAVSSGFVYMVSSAATTGSQQSFDTEKQAYFKRIAEMKLQNPTLVGFGVSNNSTYEAACTYANGAIIGSEFIKQLQKQSSISLAVSTLVSTIKGS